MMSTMSMIKIFWPTLKLTDAPLHLNKYYQSVHVGDDDDDYGDDDNHSSGSGGDGDDYIEDNYDSTRSLGA